VAYPVFVLHGRWAEVAVIGNTLATGEFQ